MTGRLRAAACLSLSGRFAPFGQQAADGLRLWADQYQAELSIVDDRSEPSALTGQLPALAATADLLFGPYSTVLTRAAIAVAEEYGTLLFNHGGSGGKLSAPGRVVNILTPARRYADPFLAHLAANGSGALYTTRGPGAFGRDVIAGAEDAARGAGIPTNALDVDQPPRGEWDLLSAGVYEDDVVAVRQAQSLPNPPKRVCSVAAGVASFADDIGDPEGVFGVGQWARGAVGDPDVGMSERDFLSAWRQRFGRWPDYPGVQAYAAGVIASEAQRIAGSVSPEALWEALAGLDCTTVFGRFRIDAATGVQTGHDSVLTQWHDGISAVASR